MKLYMTTAAMRVLPRPVGRQTSVFCSNAVWMMSTWYGLSLTVAGYTQCLALLLQQHAYDTHVTVRLPSIRTQTQHTSKALVATALLTLCSCEWSVVSLSAMCTNRAQSRDKPNMQKSIVQVFSMQWKTKAVLMHPNAWVQEVGAAFHQLVLWVVVYDVPHSFHLCPFSCSVLGCSPSFSRLATVRRLCCTTNMSCLRCICGVKGFWLTSQVNAVIRIIC